MAQFSKLQIRARVLSVISEIKSLQKITEEKFHFLFDDLNIIDDKKALFDIYLKEYIKLDEKDYNISALLLKDLIPLEYINQKSMEMLESSISDECKYKIVQLLRVTGSEGSGNIVPSYFENPDEILDKETQKLLENAVFNPESMLDFLDFVSAVADKDKYVLLESLKADYDGDILANILYPILYSDFDRKFKLQVIEILGNSKSSIAIKPLEYLLLTDDDIEITKEAKIALKKLKLAGASQEKADDYFKDIIKETKPYDFYTTIPDGNGNQAILISRITNEARFHLSAVVINDIIGIKDCFGFFDISQEELIKIIAKFYKSEGKYKVPAKYVKTKINKAMEKNIELKRPFPYEFICWNPLLSDIVPLDIPLDVYSESNCKMQLISIEDILELLTKEYTLRWFIAPYENDVIKKITDNIYNSELSDIKKINKYLIDNTDMVFDEANTEVWKNRIYDLVYLLRNNEELKNADIFYTMLKTEKYFRTFKQILIQRSVFNYFVGIRENIHDIALTKNIFRKNNSEESKYDIKKVNEIIDFLKKGWLDG